jgi:predicted Zn-dependent peptidase
MLGATSKAMANKIQVVQKAEEPEHTNQALMSYAQLLKQEVNYQQPKGLDQPMNAASILQKINQAHQSNIPIETLKQSLQHITSDILKKVLGRSD